MRKQLLLLKSLLVTVLLGVGSNAWADAETVYSQNFTADKSSGTSTDPADYAGIAAGAYSGRQSTTVSSGVFTSSVGATKADGGANQDNYNTYVASFTEVTGDYEVTFTCTWSPGGATGLGVSRLTIMDDSGNAVLTLQKGTNNSTNYHFLVNGTDVKTLGSGDNSAVYDVSATINLKSKKITALSIGTMYSITEAIDFHNSSATGVAKLEIYHKNKANWINTATLDNILFTKEAITASYADVTLKYEDTDGNDLSAYKADQVVNAEVGSTIASLITSTYTADFYNGTSNKYVYADSYTVTGDYTTVQAGGNTVTLKFTDYPSTAYTVKAQLSGADLTTLESSSTFFDGSYSAYWSKYIKVGNQWYEPNEATYGKVITSATNNVAFKTTASKGIFIEAEDMTLSRSYGDPTNNVEYSGGAGRAPYGSATLDSKTKIPAGKYTITIGTKTRNNDKDQSYKVSYSTDGSTYTQVGTISYKTSSGFHENSTDVEIPATAYIRLTEGQGANAQDYVDYVYFVQTAVAAPVSEFGKSTFSSTYPVDCSKLPSGLKAYKATAADASSVHMVEVTDAVAGMTGSNKTGLVLVGTPSTTYYIPIATTDGTEPSGNLLFGWNSSWGNLGVADSGTNFVLSVQNDEVVWAPIKSDTAPLATGQAGLWADVEINTSRSLRMVFGDNSVTGISDATRLKDKGQKTNDVFNLNGQRVKKAAKGLYIVNGKKYIK